MSKRKSIILGFLIIIVGISLVSYNYFLEKKDYAFEYMYEKIYLKSSETPEEIEGEEETPGGEEETPGGEEETPGGEEETPGGEEETPGGEEETPGEEEKQKQPTKKYNYIGYLEIPDVNFKRGFVDINSKDNDVSKNITIISGSSYPNVNKGNFIIAGHSGTGIHSYFKNLYKLKTGAKAIVYYKNVKYTYKIVKIYKQPKTGTIAIYRDYNKTTLTLVTCTKNDKKKQTVYIAELQKKESY